MSPELKQATMSLEQKAHRPPHQEQSRILDALKDAGAASTASLLESLIQKDAEVRSDALCEVARVRLSVSK